MFPASQIAGAISAGATGAEKLIGGGGDDILDPATGVAGDIVDLRDLLAGVAGDRMYHVRLFFPDVTRIQVHV